VILDAQSAMIVAIVGIAVGVVGVALAAVALLKFYRLQRSYDLLSVREGQESMVDVIARTREEIADLSDEVVATQRELLATRRDLAAAIRHVAVVRYDAFGDMGGRYSFSAALLDDAGDGLMITSIHGRTETRSYLKGVRAGASDIDLSPEEQQAIAIARGVIPPMRDIEGGAA
jgi:hypothetical protein